MKNIKFTLLTSLLLISITSSFGKTLKGAIDYYNKSFQHAGSCFSKINDPEDMKLLSKIMYANKISTLASINKSKNGIYTLEDGKIKIKLTGT